MGAADKPPSQPLAPLLFAIGDEPLPADTTPVARLAVRITDDTAASPAAATWIAALVAAFDALDRRSLGRLMMEEYDGCSSLRA
jgi:hypothetical protein